MKGIIINPIVITKNLNGMWIKVDLRHKTAHFLPLEDTETLCGIKSDVGTYMISPTEQIRNCPTCERLVLDAEPILAEKLRMIEPF